MRISDWSSDVCSSDLEQAAAAQQQVKRVIGRIEAAQSCRCAPGKEIAREDDLLRRLQRQFRQCSLKSIQRQIEHIATLFSLPLRRDARRSEEHTSELQ